MADVGEQVRGVLRKVVAVQGGGQWPGEGDGEMGPRVRGRRLPHPRDLLLEVGLAARRRGQEVGDPVPPEP
ncbi:hypothetical protein ACFYRG_27640 [Streptomyces mirabilis]|uniref:hypothetical protein n=1 Tax=Streptomyces mirabilis TaxID=68239 RepID=UPI00369EA241